LAYVMLVAFSIGAIWCIYAMRILGFL